MKKVLSCAKKLLVAVLTLSAVMTVFLPYRGFAAEFPVKTDFLNPNADFGARFGQEPELCKTVTNECFGLPVSILNTAKEGTMATNASIVYSSTAPDAALKSVLCGDDGEAIDIPVTLQYYKVGITLSDEELQLLYYVIDTEVVSGSVDHKMVVTEVILNRVKSNRFPNRVKTVLLAPNQFCTAKHFYNKKNFVPSKKTVTAVNNVLSGEYPDKSQGALYFCNPKKTSSNWFETSLKPLFDMEGHRFYTYR